MALGPIQVLASPPPVAGWLILGGLLLYGGASLWEDFTRALGIGPRDDGPLISLPLGLVVVGVGLVVLGTRN